MKDNWIQDEDMRGVGKIREKCHRHHERWWGLKWNRRNRDDRKEGSDVCSGGRIDRTWWLTGYGSWNNGRHQGPPGLVFGHWLAVWVPNFPMYRGCSDYVGESTTCITLCDCCFFADSTNVCISFSWNTVGEAVLVIGGFSFYRGW